MAFICCECDHEAIARQSQLARGRIGATIGDRMRHAGIAYEFAIGTAGFHTFKPQNGAQAKASQLAQRWADGDVHSVYLFGPPGTGKTHLGESAAVRLIERGENVRFLSARRLAQELRAAMAEGMGADVALLDQYSTVRFLVLDDVGTVGRVSTFVAESLLALIDSRTRNKRPTLANSNYSLAELAPRLSASAEELSGFLICDRIRELSTMAHMSGMSYRGRKGAE
jgi:DNA replication protein